MKKQQHFVLLMALGFLFLLMNYSIEFPNGSLNLLPDWLGYLFFYLAFQQYNGDDFDDLRKMVLIAGAIAFVMWVAGIFTKVNLGILRIPVDFFTAYVLYMILEPVIRIAARIDSSQTERLIHCRQANLLCSLIILLSDVIYLFIRKMSVVLFTLCLLVGFIVAVLNIVALFRLSSELTEA